MREPLLEPGLERVVAGVDAVLHPLDVAEAGIRPRASRLGTVRVGDDRRLVQIAEAVQLRALVADIGKVEEQVGHQLVLDAEVVLLDVRRALVRILRAARPPSSTATWDPGVPTGSRSRAGTGPPRRRRPRPRRRSGAGCRPGTAG